MLSPSVGFSVNPSPSSFGFWIWDLDLGLDLGLTIVIIVAWQRKMYKQIPVKSLLPCHEIINQTSYVSQVVFDAQRSLSVSV